MVAASNAVLSAHHLPTLPGEVIINAMVLPTAPRMGSHAGISDPARQLRLAEEFYARAHDLPDGLVHAYPGVEAVLLGARTAGLVIGVVSNNQGALVRKLMRAVGLARYCQLIWGEEDVPAPKPDPRGIDAARRALGVAVEDCVYVGDGVTDVHGAHRAGMAVIGVTWGIHARGEMQAMGFDRLVDTPQELADELHLDDA